MSVPTDSRSRGLPPPPSGMGMALASAVLFGMTTPIAKGLLAGTSPLAMAGLLYLGSGVGLTLLRWIQDRGSEATRLPRTDWPWLACATLTGGVLAPALLMLGLARADAAPASLLLNLEVVFTAMLAWFAFRESTSRRVVIGLIAIFAGGVLLVIPWGGGAAVTGLGMHLPEVSALSLIALACLCWGLDNNLTRKISASDSRLIAAIKGLTAGATNTVIAFLIGASFPEGWHLAGLLVLGFLGYGLSLVLFILALRELGTARTSAYFATAPFIGAAVSLLVFGQSSGPLFWLAAGCMAAGVWVHTTEHHEHEHSHEPLVHSHAHAHDEHHRHSHGSDWDGTEPHTHEHYHPALRHAHAHFPDIHHRHEH